MIIDRLLIAVSSMNNQAFCPETRFKEPQSLMRRIPDTELRNAIHAVVHGARRYAGRKAWLETISDDTRRAATSGGTVIRVPSLRLTGTKLFSRGRQTFAADDDYAQGPILGRRAHAGLSSKVSDFYGSKGAVVRDRRRSVFIPIERLSSPEHKRDKHDGRGDTLLYDRDSFNRYWAHCTRAPMAYK